MGIDSLRAEITWFESARAYAAADGRDEVTLDDLKAVAPMALRLRRSQFMNEYFKGQLGEEKELNMLLGGFSRNSASKKRAKPVKQTSKKK
jgi:magnesium chelatase subunit I